MVEQVVVDVLLVHCTPEWPAALPMLLRLITALHSKAGMHCPDNAVRQIAVDLLGLIAGQLCFESKRAEIDMPVVNEILQEAGRSPLASLLLQQSSSHVCTCMPVSRSSQSLALVCRLPHALQIVRRDSSPGRNLLVTVQFLLEGSVGLMACIAAQQNILPSACWSDHFYWIVQALQTQVLTRQGSCC